MGLFVLWAMFPRSRLAGQKLNAYMSFLNTGKFFSVRIVPFFIPIGKTWVSLSPLWPPSKNVLSNFSVLAHLLDGEWRLWVVYFVLLLLWVRLLPNAAQLSQKITPFYSLCHLFLILYLYLWLILRWWVLLIHWNNRQNRMIISSTPNAFL